MESSTYVSSLVWVSRGHARAMPKEVQLTAQQIEQMRVQAEEDCQSIPNFSGMEEEQFGQGQNNYPQAIQDLSDEEMENFVIRETDAIIVAGKVDDDDSTLEIYIYEQEKNNLYCHHEVQLSAFPLDLQWVGMSQNRKANLAVVATFLQEIEIWDLDVMNQVQPLAVLGGQQKTNTKKNKKKKGNKKYKPGSHTDAVCSLDLNSVHLNILASGSADRTVKIWDLQKTSCVQTFRQQEQRVELVRWNRVQKEALLSISSDSLINIFDSRSPKSGLQTKICMEIQAANWSLDKSHEFVVAGSAGLVQIYDARNLAYHFLQIKAHQSQISGVDYSLNQTCVTSSFDGNVKLWSTVQGELIGQQQGKCGKLTSLRVFQDDRGIIGAGNEKGQLYIWDMRENEKIEQRLNFVMS